VTKSKVLIANRGEIASRVIRASQELGYEAIAAFSEADRDSRWVRQADSAICIGPPPAAKSYLNLEAVVQAALDCGATSVHPGYGFLAENEEFAASVIAAGLIWIGPPPRCIGLMGDKSSALAVATKAGVPTLPRSGVLASLDDALAQADVLGYPLLLKANAGGGGRGIRPIANADSLSVNFDQARAEVGAAFGDNSLYLEKLLTGARHVEVQIICDGFGNSIHLYERDCSLQRRRQKVVEEAPSSSVQESTRAQLAEAALRLAKAVEYESVGTVEFLVAQDQSFYFIEMNTRVQVEHGVTELVTGIDIVREQLRIAHAEPLSLEQSDVKLRGAAIEVRVNAEDPDMNFIGSPGLITLFEPPSGPGIRVDTGFGSGDSVQPFYDSLICKVLAHDVDRVAAIRRLELALKQVSIAGVTTNVPFLSKAIALPSFRDGTHHTQTLEDEMERSS